MAYFDNAATTFPKPEIVYSFMDDFYRNFGSSYGRGNYKNEQSVEKIVTDARNKLKKLLHCESKDVVFTPTATIALNIVIQGLIKKGAKYVYITPFEHNAITRILEYYKSKMQIEIRYLPLSKTFSYDFEEIKYLFDDKKPDLVIMTHASNVIGMIFPVEEIVLLAKKYNATTIVDMAQTAGLVDLDVGLDTIDFAVFAGHKTLYAPTGISGFIAKRGQELEPVLFGGTGFDSANQEMPSSVPERFEIGTLNTHAVAGLYASLSWIEEKGICTLYNKEVENRNKIITILSNYDFINVIGNLEDLNYVGIVSFTIKGISSDNASKIFKEHNVSVRTGLHCAPLAHKFLGTFPSGTIRISTSFFNSDEDFKELSLLLDYIEENL